MSVNKKMVISVIAVLVVALVFATLLVNNTQSFRKQGMLMNKKTGNDQIVALLLTLNSCPSNPVFVANF